VRVGSRFSLLFIISLFLVNGSSFGADEIVGQALIRVIEKKTDYRVCVISKIRERTRLISSTACTPTKDGECRSYEDCVADAAKNDLATAHGVLEDGDQKDNQVQVEGRTCEYVTTAPSVAYYGEHSFCSTLTRCGFRGESTYSRLSCPGVGTTKENRLICPRAKACELNKFTATP